MELIRGDGKVDRKGWEGKEEIWKGRNGKGWY